MRLSKEDCDELAKNSVMLVICALGLSAYIYWLFYASNFGGWTSLKMMGAVWAGILSAAAALTIVVLVAQLFCKVATGVMSLLIWKACSHWRAGR